MTSVLARLLVSQSGEQDRRTPLKVFEDLNKEFNFELDPCTSLSKENNLKTPHYFTKKQNGLEQDWNEYKSIFINPPFNQLPKMKWNKKIHEELSKSKDMTIVILVPCKTETDWWHDFISSKFLKELRFQKRRLTFEGHKDPFIIGIAYFIFKSNQCVLSQQGEAK